jgi:inorganic pyrophosphatase
VIVANTSAIVPGALMNCRIVGVLFMRDEAGFDEIIVAVPSTRLTKRYQNCQKSPYILRQFGHFFAHYKDLEPGKWVWVEPWGDAAEARQIVAQSIERAAVVIAQRLRVRRKTPCSPNRFQIQGSL